jgi:hypothetical protein
MDRRTFLKTVAVSAGALSAGGLLSACSRGTAVPSGEPGIVAINASFETLTGTGRRVAFGLRTFDNQPLDVETAEVFLRPLDGGDASGPFTASYAEDAGGTGVYVVELDVPEPGVVELVANTEQGFGTFPLKVVRPEDSEAPVPGGEAIAAATPTTEDPAGYAVICTQAQPCGMHDVSLDEALQAGGPVVVLFATPKYCVSAVCGPAVATLDTVRTSQDWGEVTFIHVEIFSDEEGQQLGEPVQEWGLPTEPWAFSIDAGGTIVERLDGPMPEGELRRIVQSVA